MNPIQLARPPIREAVLDIQTQGPSDLEAVRRLAESFGKQSGLSKSAAVRAGLIEMAMSADESITSRARAGVTGYRVEDEPVTKVVQFRNNGFTFSLIGNYAAWEQFRDAAVEPAARFLALSGVERVTRLALRYINVIQLPHTRVDLDQYLPAAPRVPSELPQELAGFFSRIVLPIQGDGLNAVVTQALEEGAKPSPSVILDIEVYFQGPLTPEWGSLLPIFENIRTWKNRIFFAFVNENTVSLHS